MILRCSAVAVLIGALSGCGYSHYRAAPQTAKPATPSPTPRWPTTWTGDLPATTARVADLQLRSPAVYLRNGTGPADTALLRELVVTPVGSGLITYTRDAGGGPPSDEATFDYFAWRERPAALDGLRVAPDGRTEAASLWALSASAPFHMEFRVWYPQVRAPRGVVLYQWGLSGYRYEKELVRALSDRGWVVLCHNGLSWKRPGALTVTPDVPGSSPPKPSEGISVAGPGPEESRPDPATRKTYLDATAALAATDFDDAVGQYALANETALAFVMQNHPLIPDKPLVIVGCSFGAIMTPTVAARLEADGRPVDAVVLIGGGTNFLDVAGSTWMDYYYSRVRGRGGTELHLNLADRKTVSAEYLERSTLDPYHTAQSLREKKVLMLHASMDDIVPASRGDDLWERAGRPERWVGNFGHLFMFATLSWKADDIAEWLGKACPDPVPQQPGDPP